MKKDIDTKHKICVNNTVGGITLIALVITIVVLLILVGISFSMMLGENGVLMKAAEAKMTSDRARIVERVNLAYNAVKTRMLGEIVDENTMKELTINELIREDFDVKSKTTSTTEITEITLVREDGSILSESEIISLNKEDINGDIYIQYNAGTTTDTKHYILVNDKYYELTISENGTVLGETAYEITDLEDVTTSDEIELEYDDTYVMGNITDVENDETKDKLIITGIDKNTTTITIKNKNGNINKTISVEITDKELSLDKSNITFNLRDDENIIETLAVTKRDLTEDVSWASSDTEIVSINPTTGDNVTVTRGTKVGTATITATCEGCTASCIVTVSNKGIDLSETNIAFDLTDNVNTTATLIATKEELTGEISWASSDTEIVSINPTTGDNVTVTKGTKAGTATITATCDGYTAECIVKVKAVYTASMITKDEYGKTVDYGVSYVDATTDGTAEWIVYHSDGEHIYLTTKGCIAGNINRNYTGSTEFTNATKLAYYPAVTAGWLSQVYNPEAEEDSRLIYSSTKDNMKTTLYLLDSRVWGKYANSDAAWAIGGPTAELFIEAYNEYFTDTKTVTLNPEGQGYSLFLENVPWGSVFRYGLGYYIASPHSSAQAHIMFFSGVGNIGYSNVFYNYDNAYFRPIVCLNSNITLAAGDGKTDFIIQR